MKKLLNYSIILLLMLLSSCSDDNNGDSGNEEMDFQLQIDIADDMLDLYEDLLLQNTPEQSRIILVESLIQVADIRDAGISEDGTTICWEYKDGLEYCFLTETALTLDIADRRANNAKRETTSSFNDPIIVPENKNALILSPYQYEWSFFDFLDESDDIASMLTSNNYTVNYKFNDDSSLGDISLEDYKGFNNYSVIAISTHGGVARDGEVFINSGVLITEQIRSSLKDDFDNKLMGVMFSRHLFPWQRHKVIGLKANWFDREYETKLNQTLVHIGACKGYYNQTLSNALIGNESAFLGWTDNVRADINTENAINLFQNLFEGSTVEEAYNHVVENGSTTSGTASFTLSSNSYDDLALISNERLFADDFSGSLVELDIDTGNEIGTIANIGFGSNYRFIQSTNEIVFRDQNNGTSKIDIQTGNISLLTSTYYETYVVDNVNNRLFADDFSGNFVELDINTGAIIGTIANIGFGSNYRFIQSTNEIIFRDQNNGTSKIDIQTGNISLLTSTYYETYIVSTN